MPQVDAKLNKPTDRDQTSFRSGGVMDPDAFDPVRESQPVSPLVSSGPNPTHLAWLPVVVIAGRLIRSLLDHGSTEA